MSPVRACPLDTLETKELSQREIILKTYFLQTETTGTLAEMNGSLQELKGDMYGVPDRQIPGVKPCVQAHEQKLARWSTILRIVRYTFALSGTAGTAFFVKLLVD